MNKWVLVGFFGQFLFASRFLIQWISSEIKQKSHFPVAFWYLSVAGGGITLIYSIYRQDPVFIVGQAGGLLVYVRNLFLIRKNKKRRSSEPKEA